LPERRGRYKVTVVAQSLIASRSVYMSDADAIYFAFGLATGFALFGVLLGMIWKRR
jgi:hypothetical protein